MRIRIASDLELPEDVVTQAIAILARRGAGKTHTASVLVEEVVRAKLPVVVIDPTGAWWGLRSSADGESPGLPVVILGGEHGDVPLERSAGSEVADVVVQHPGAYVLDLSALPSRTAEQTFVADFLEHLYRAKASRREALLVVVDEADVFAPQRPGAEQARSLGAMEAIVRRGRIRGLGCLLISQRAAVLNKNVLTQTEVLVAMQTTGPQDRAAIDDWVRGNGTDEERSLVIGSLASLERGEAWVWSPSWLRILQRVRIRPRTTFDSSRTPGAGETAAAPRAYATVDLPALTARMAAVVEQAKADDPRVLRTRIAVLERQLADRPAPTVERVEVPVLRAEQLAALEREAADLVRSARSLSETGGLILAAIGRIGPPQEKEDRSMRPGGDAATTAPATAEGRTKPSKASGATGLDTDRRPLSRRSEPARPTASAPSSLKPPERAILTALAQYPQGRTQQQVALLSGYSSTSGSFFGALASLRRARYIEGTTSELRTLPAGLDALGGWEPLPTGNALITYWLDRLKPPERAVLSALIDAWPDALTQAEVAATAGYSATSGSFFGALAKLRKLELITGTSAALRASDDIAEHR